MKFKDKWYKSEETFGYVDRRTKCTSRVQSLRVDGSELAVDCDISEALRQHYSKFPRMREIFPLVLLLKSQI